MRPAWILFCCFAFPKIASSPSKYDPCYRRELKVREVMEATRMGASLFPCLVSKILMPYKPTAAMVLAGQKFICSIVSFCFGTQLSAKLSARDELEALAKCHIKFINVTLNMGAWEFFKLKDLEVEGSVHKEQLPALMADTFKCFEGLSLAQLKDTPEISLNVFRFIIEKMF